MTFAFFFTLIVLAVLWIAQGGGLSFLFLYIAGNLVYAAQLAVIKANFPNALDVIPFELLSSDAVVERLLFWQTYFNVTLLLALAFSKVVRAHILSSLHALIYTPRKPQQAVSSTSTLENIALFIMYSMCYGLALFYPWPNFGEAFTVGHSVSAWAKIGLSYMIALAGVKANSRKLMLLALLTVPLFMLEKSRTTFFHILIILIVCNALHGRTLSASYKIAIGTVLFFTFAGVTVLRNDAEVNLLALMYPFIYEGILGGFSGLQTVSLLDAGHAPSVEILKNWARDFVPTALELFDSLPLCETGRTLHCSIDASGFLNEKFSPMGGHYILAETPLLFGFAAPFFYFAYVMLFLRIALIFKDPALRVVLVSTTFVLIKADIYVGSKFALAIFLVASLLSFLIKFPYRCLLSKC